MVRTVDKSRKPAENNSNNGKKPTVAVIGLGMSGCVTAHFLADKYNVTCFEINSVPGLYAHSVTDLPGAVSRLDMPLRAVSPHYYRNLYQLYNYLGIELEQTNYQHTVVDLDTKQKLFSYINICCFGLAIPLPYISFARFASALLVLIGFLQFVFLTPWTLFWNRTTISKMSLQEYLNEYNYNTEFQHLFFFPILSTLLSCSYRQTQKYPAVLIAEFMCANATTLFTGWFRVRGAGVYGVASQLLRGLEPQQCHFNTRVLSVSTKQTSSGKTKVEVVAEHNFQWNKNQGNSSSSSPSAPGAAAPSSPLSSFGGVERESNHTKLFPPKSDTCSGSETFVSASSSVGAKGTNSSDVNQQHTHTFDHVIVCVEPDVARRIVVTDSTSSEGRCISEFLNSTKFFTADIVAHRDPTFMGLATSNNETEKTAPSTVTKELNFSSSSSNTTNGNGSKNKFSVTKTTSSPAQQQQNNNNNKKSSSSFPRNILTSSSFKDALSKIVAGVFPYVDTPSTGLTVYGTGVDAAAAFSSPAAPPRNASTTTANVTLLWNVNNNNNNSGDSSSSSSSSSEQNESSKDGNNTDESSNNNDTNNNTTVLFETWNPIGLPKNIVKRARMTRAVWDVSGFNFADQFARHAQGYGNIWFAGSYCSRGVTLLEQACTSALDVAMDFGCNVPFKVYNPQESPMNSSWWMLLISIYLNIISYGVECYVSVIKFLFSTLGCLVGKGNKKSVVMNTSSTKARGKEKKE